jgi:TubC N-terminal docking domain
MTTLAPQSEASALLDDLRAIGVMVEVIGDRLKIDAPAGVITEDQRQALRVSKPAIIKLLTTTTTDAPRSTQTTTATTPASSWDAKDRKALTTIKPGLRAAVDLIAEVFGSVSIEAIEGDGSMSPRQRAAAAMRQVRQTDRPRARALRDGWRERLAICIVDGGIDEHDAEKIAADELETLILATR